MIKHLEKESDFNEIIKNEVLIDFYADWCGPCKMLLPVLDEIDFIDVVEINVDLFPDIAKRFGIMSIPTLIFFRDGLEVDREIGFRSLEEIKEAYKESK